MNVEVTIPKLLLTVHEAAHAVVGVITGRALRYITIRPDDECDGHCQFDDQGEDVDPVEHAAGLLAGDVAVKRFAQKRHVEVPANFNGFGSGDDEAMGRIRLDRDQRQLARERAEELVEAHWATINEVALTLLQHERLDGNEVRAIVG